MSSAASSSRPHGDDYVRFLEATANTNDDANADNEARIQTVTSNEKLLEEYGVENGDTVVWARSVTPVEDSDPTLKTLFFMSWDSTQFHLKDVPLSLSVSNLKKRVALHRGYDPETIRFLWANKQLEDERTLESYSLRNESTVHMVSRVLGGDNLDTIT
ncbi:hypothetical protein GQ53DRAFT_821092 [Thozetella sp. PMI_491]|nr:hypothetical protein GQ53DRAFT_821092 [Thozetella sp. PMI_491]